jgi:hypothetical protein
MSQTESHEGRSRRNSAQIFDAITRKVERDTQNMSLVELQAHESFASSLHMADVRVEGKDSQAATNSLFYWGLVGAKVDAEEIKTVGPATSTVDRLLHCMELISGPRLRPSSRK